MSLLAGLLSFFYNLIPNYAAAITLLTIAVMVVLLPLTIKGTRSMLAMQKLGPEIKKLQDRHKNDRQKLNEEMMALYKDNKINPLGGCLPLLLQMPVWILLYQVIFGISHKNSAGVPEPKHIDHSTKLYQQIVSDKGELNSFGIDLASTAKSVHDSFVASLPYFLLIIAMVLLQYWQQYQVMSRTPSSADTPQAQQMRMMQKFFPPLFGVISIGFPAGVVLYSIVSSLFRIGQQAAMYKYDPLLRSTVASAKKEAEEFLKNDSGNGRINGGSKNSKNQSSKKKKRKGR